MHVRVKAEWTHVYRKPGSAVSGVITALSPDGTVVRIRMDDLGDSYIWVDHIEPVQD